MPHEYLLFRISGPLAAWGEIAVGERRSSWPRPSKSAVLGLVAAALGYDRHDAAGHAALNDGLRFAVRVDVPMRSHSGEIDPDPSLKPLRDYHTAQVPSARRGKKWATRAEELDERQLNTILSERWYWINMTATVALWPSGPGSALPLVEIEAALREPIFVLYLGRKSCPLSHPLFPKLIGEGELRAAFQNYDLATAPKQTEAKETISARKLILRQAISCAVQMGAGPEIWADLDATRESERKEIYSRRDAIRDRRSWTFSDREEARIDAGGSDVSIAS